MAKFFPSLDAAGFSSKGEYDLFRQLHALDDEYIVVHSLPWLRGRTKRIYSKTLEKYVYETSRKHISGEVDFVVLHPLRGILCIEVKSGIYVPSGPRFVLVATGETVDALGQAKDNAFALVKTLDEEDLKCPVGYGLHFPDMDWQESDLASGFKPIDGISLNDGILILRRHVPTIKSRIDELMQFWKAALKYPDSQRFDTEIASFLSSVWPDEIQSNTLGRRIAVDNQLWLKLDPKQSERIAACLRKDRQLTAGYSGSGKTLIARVLAEDLAHKGSRVLMLFKNRKISRQVFQMLPATLASRIVVKTFHSYCEEQGATATVDDYGDLDFDAHHAALDATVDDSFDVLIIDEAQALAESEHIALSQHFQNAKIYLFADQFQVLPAIESGVTYEFLQKQYGCGLPYFLANVYRSPGGVVARMLEMHTPDHYEVVIQRPRADTDFARSVVWEVWKAVQAKVAEYVARGVQAADVVVLTQFPKDSTIPGIEFHTISTFRGMESPIVIIVPNVATDDVTLVCAMGRATTQAVILVDASLVPARHRLKSAFLRDGLDAIDMEDFRKKDATRGRPCLVGNLVEKYANFSSEHIFAGEVFRYSSFWKRWLIRNKGWSSRGAELWGWVVQRRSNAPILGLDEWMDDLTSCSLRHCGRCNGVTPHSSLRCLPCESESVSSQILEELSIWSTNLADIKEKGYRSLVRVAELIGEFQFPKFKPSITMVPDDDEIAREIASTVIEYRMLHQPNSVTKVQMESWVEEVLLKEELKSSVAALTGRSISSLCSRGVIRRMDKHIYELV